jgi:hypothetical protein
MPNYNIIEFFDSRQISASTDAKTILFKWLVQTFGDADEGDIYQYVCAPQANSTPLAPYQVDGLNRNDVKIKNIAGSGGIWAIDVTYGSAPVIAALDVQDTLPQYQGLNAPLTVGVMGSVTGKTTHITQALKTVWNIQGGGTDVIASGSNAVMGTGGQITLDGSPFGLAIGQAIVFAPNDGWTPGLYTVTNVSGYVVTVDTTNGSPAQNGTTEGSWVVYSAAVQSGTGSGPNLGNVIGMSLDGVRGADIIIPLLEFTLEGVISPFAMADVNTYYQLTGKVNASQWWNFAPGEALLQGVDFKLFDQIACRVSLKIACQPSVYNLVITPQIILPFKAGWDLVDVTYLPDTVGGFSAQVAKSARVLKVYLDGDFSDLGAG